MWRQQTSWSTSSRTTSEARLASTRAQCSFPATWATLRAHVQSASCGKHPSLYLRVAVAHRHTSEVWLEGDLERGVVPDNCVWTAGGGAGEDGFLVLLEKMNLELLRRCGRLTRRRWG